MNEVRSKVRARSIVGLYRDATIESLPIDEVKADLARMGIDPAPTVRFAKVLADRGSADPSVQLLQKLEKAEAVDKEISDIERASIDDILSSLPAPNLGDAEKPASFSEKTVVEEIEKEKPEQVERPSTADMTGVAVDEMAEARAGEIEKAEADEAAETVDKAEADEAAETVGKAEADEVAETVEKAKADEAAETVEKAEADEKVETDEIELVETANMIREEKVVPLQKISRKSVLRWGGGLVGLAASLLIFVAVRPDVSDSVRPVETQDVQLEDKTIGEGAVRSIVAEEEESVLAGDALIEGANETAALSSALSSRQLQEPLAGVGANPEEREASALLDARAESIDNLALAEAAAAAEQVPGLLAADVDAPTAPAVAGDSQPTPPESSASPSAGAFATFEAADARESTLAARSAVIPDDVADGSKAEVRAPSSYVPIIVSPPSAEPAVEARARPRLEPNQAEVAAITSLPDVEKPPLGPDNLTGIFIVDANRVPAELIALAERKRDDRLAAKLGEASLRALGRKVAALVAIERGGERVEAALVEVEGEKLSREADAVIEFFSDGRAVNLEGWTRSVELLELPNRR